MSSQSEAQKELEALNGTQVEGQTLIVNEAKPREKRTPGRWATPLVAAIFLRRRAEDLASPVRASRTHGRLLRAAIAS